LLPLTDFGYYALAAAVAGVLFLMIQPVNQAIYPRLVVLASTADTAGLAGLYHLGAQLVSVITAPVAALLVLHAEGVIFAWSGDALLAKNTGLLLAVLAFGTFLNGLFWMPYLLRLAHGWTRLTLLSNAIAVALLVPAILWVVPRQGAIGAAWIWVTLNVGFFMFAIPLMHRRLLPQEMVRWYGMDVLLPATAAFGTVLLTRDFSPTTLSSRIDWMLYLLAEGGIALAATTACAGNVRRQLRAYAPGPRAKPSAPDSP
jgi:O-antigen/teichoic acid export membrane protein